jgi:RNA-binding protein
MSASVSPKKRSLMPSSPLRRSLRGAGHALSAIVQIGKEGTTPAVLKQLAQALRDHELVKVKVGSECPETRFETADQLAAVPDTQLAQVLGRTLLVYKRDPERLRFEGGAGKPARATPPPASATPKKTRPARPPRGRSGKAAKARPAQPARGTFRKKSATSPRR